MRQWLPWAILVVLALVVAVIPWRKPDPKHEFMLYMLRNVAAGEAAPVFPEDLARERTHTIEYGTGAGHHHGAGGTDV
jgi:hypothetical protein